jgi:DNA-directed RNA polymerase II subunit RPB2
MEVARHVIETFFKDTPNPLVRHHLDSFDDLLSMKIPGFIRGKNPLIRNLTDGRIIEIYVGGKDGNEFTYSPPVDESGAVVLPHVCRLENKTYSLEMRGTIEIHYIMGDTDIVRFENVVIGRIPLMLKSPLCTLSTMTSAELYDAGECKFELGGYFIINGAEKALLSQERLGDNMFYASKRIQTTSSVPSVVGLTEKEDTESKIEGSTKGEKYEYIAGIRTINEAGTRGPYYHFLVIPPKNLKPDDAKSIANASNLADFTTKRLATIQLPGFSGPVPVMSVFHALGISNDKDIYDTIFAGVPDQERTIYDETFMELLLSHERFLEQTMKAESDQNQDANLLVLKRQCRTPTQTAVYVNLYNDLFSHCEFKEESAASLYRRKAYLLGHMLKMAIDVSLEIKPKSDRDHYRYKRIDSSGDLCFEQFRRIYKDVSSNMLLRMEERAFYEASTYAGKKIKDLIKDTPNNYWWTSYTFLAEFEKAFKGQWGGKNGISQELTRFSYPGTVAMLRRVNLQMDKSTKAYEARRIHGSSWGFMCPTDNPDGGNVGMIKSLTLFCSLTTATPSSQLFNIVSNFKTFKPVQLIHPSKWNPGWTKVFINSDLVGVFEKGTETFHYDLTEKRRSREISKFVSLCWNRLDNEYIIFTDAGRVSRPVYREGTKAEFVKRVSKWVDFDKKIIDYIDPQETESLLVKMEPFSDKQVSEIHGITILSASASFVPNSDFSQSVRSMFSCQQIKHACSWFNTAFNKRFDTHATWLNYAQQPLSQTWTAKHIMGGNGCLGYGENSIVALGIYSGYNQEDSIILNDSALKRGMFNTIYYHSYDIQEEMVNVSAGTNTEFANIVSNPRFRETVLPKPGMNYEKLDGDGIIVPGSSVTDDTVLVGIVSPSTNQDGQVNGYVDKSYKPKKGQRGVVDSVYRYTVSVQGFGNTVHILRGVKIRIAESRIPELGDKFCSRHGQKGTVGIRMAEEDMPYTSSGLRPDMIVNPHAFPSRMTIGQFIESMGCKVGAELGSMIDSTPFSTQNRIGELKDIMKKMGMHPYGHEVMYNGQTGEMMDVEIFIGPTYYLRLKLMTEDKINYRTTGPRTLLTHQPVSGRADDGGLRIGEMERDCLISHGMSKFLNESMMERSDKSDILLQPETGYLDSTSELEGTKISTPYSLGLIIRELEAMHISVRLAAP